MAKTTCIFRRLRFGRAFLKSTSHSAVPQHVFVLRGGGRAKGGAVKQTEERILTGMAPWKPF